ncbi:hypothetical protein DPX16_20175 [Anabarilius grahami]|uniref:Secreted protein n=1 Tax=Anabarilius grahami TaxID=495550 RepID=A0A3N0Z4R1_ANAGA|nr:hypothetical protein DPX16_20175 [Anabarilius grahami]
MRPSWVVFLINTLWALLRGIKRDGTVDDGNPVAQQHSSAAVPASSAVNYANLISGTHRSSALCVRVCVLSLTQAGVQMRLRPREQREPRERSPMAAQQSQNEGEDNEPVRCASDILEHAQKDKSGN